MKIKRFEAASMSGALKLIKQEFGDEAVILSAKSYKKSRGLLNGNRSAQVVVTAAVDPPAVPSKNSSLKQEENVSQIRPTDRVGAHPPAEGKLKFLKRFNPITRTGQQKLQSKFVGMTNASRDKNDNHSVYQQLVRQGVKDAIADDMNNKVSSLILPGVDDPEEKRNALSHVIQAQQVVERPPALSHPTPRIVVLVGPAGAGKTTMAAKLAAMQVKQAPSSAAFLSLDDRRVAGCAELERYADILGIPLLTPHEPDEIAPILDNLSHHQLIVVDTPGLAIGESELREHLQCMIASLPNAEIHLLLNADSQDGTHAKAVSYFKPVGIQFLAFTRLDWADSLGGLLNQATDRDLPITYLSNSAKVDQGIQWATADKLADLLMASASHGKIKRTLFNSVATAQENSAEPRHMNYVANRNSDIFHKGDCQSVKRINSENMVAFNDPADAMGRQFKPCRMCCGELLISKPIQRVAYKYASSR